MRLFRTLLCLAVLVALGVVAAGSAGAATISGWIGGKGATPAIVTAPSAACYGTMTTINGTGFVSDGGVPKVTIGGVPSSEVIVGSNTIIYARVGNGATSGPVVVTTPAGSVTATPNANVVACQATAAAEGKPTISTITSKAKGGKKFRLLGTGYVGTTSVKVGGLTATYSIPGDGIMYVIMPEAAKNGVVSVDVTNNKGTVKASLVKTA